MKMEGKRKYFILGGAALALAGIIYWNCTLNDAAGEAGSIPTPTPGDTLSIEGMANEAAANAGESYFEAFRAERESVRELELQYLDEIIETSASDAETLADAQAQKLAVVSNMEAEFTIESLIRAKGFADAAVTFHGGSVNVVIDAQALDAEQVAQILDVVQRETGESAENIKVIANSQ